MGLALGYSAILVVLVSYVVLAHKENVSHHKQYRVVQKADNKIVYTPLNTPNDLHVMEFGGWDSDSVYYKYTNIGDTISGQDYILDMPTAISWDTDYLGNKISSFSVKGKTLDDLNKMERETKAIARRDSMLREINSRQK